MVTVSLNFMKSILSLRHAAVHELKTQNSGQNQMILKTVCVVFLRKKANLSSLPLPTLPCFFWSEIPFLLHCLK